MEGGNCSEVEILIGDELAEFFVKRPALTFWSDRRRRHFRRSGFHCALHDALLHGFFSLLFMFPGKFFFLFLPCCRASRK